jgi:hypothetical protein
MLRSFEFPDGTVVFDYTLTLMACVVMSTYAKLPLVLVTIFSLILGEMLHYIFSIRTNTLVFLKLVK